MCKPASNEWPETQLYKKRAHRFSPRHATAPIVCLFAPSFRRLNIKSGRRKSTKHRQQTPTNTRKRQKKDRLIYICAQKSPCQTATPRRAHSDLQANNDNIAQNRLDCGPPPAKSRYTQRCRNEFGKNRIVSGPKIHTPSARSPSQNSSIFYKNPPTQRRFSCAIPTKQLQKRQSYRFYSKYVKQQQNLQHFCVTFTPRKFGRKTQNFSVKIFGRKAQNSVSTAKFAVFEGQITLKKATKQWVF